MKLPNSEQAYVPKPKIVDYLLSEVHEDGKHKAAFYRHFGFTAEHWERLRDALLEHASVHNVASTLDTSRGTHYAVEGELNTPSGQRPLVRSVWKIEDSSKTPRLITAYPLKRKKGTP